MHCTAICSREPGRGHWAAYTNYVDNIVYRALLRTAATSVRASQYLPFTVFFYRLATCWTTPTPGKPLPRYSRLGQSASYSKLKKKQFFSIVLLFDQTFLAEHVELYAARYHLSKISFLWSYQNNHLKKIICMSRHQDFSVKMSLKDDFCPCQVRCTSSNLPQSTPACS